MQFYQQHSTYYNHDNNFHVINKYNSEKITSQINFSGCILKHTLFNRDLDNLDKVFHVLASGIASINKHTHGVNAAALPAKSWAKMLSCSKSKVFELQKSMEQKGYFFIARDSNEAGRIKRNKITPILPNHHLNSLLSATDKYDRHNDSDNNANELLQSEDILLKMEYLRRNKLFITIDYQLLKKLAAADEYNSFAKVLFLDLYCRGYVYSIAKHGKLTNNPKVVISYKTLAKEHGYSKSVISVAINSLKNAGLISCLQFRCKNVEHKNLEDRNDESRWEITISTKAKNTKDCSTKNDIKTAQDKDYVVSDSGHLYIKDIILKNIDSIDKLKIELKKLESIRSNFLNSQSSNNKTPSPDKQDNQKFSRIDQQERPKTVIKKDHKDDFEDAPSSTIDISRNINQDHNRHTSRFLLDDVKQITEQEAEILRQRSGRGFNLNAINQILCEMQKKGLKKAFSHLYAFRKWFTDALKGEMRQEAIMNMPGYQTKRNAEANGDNAKAAGVQLQPARIEKYLNSIENSQGNDEYSQLKRKIAGNLEAKAAYEVLTSLRGSKQVGNEEVELEFCQIADKERLESAREALLRAVRSVYGSAIKSLSFKTWKSNKANADTSSNSMQSDAEYLANLPQQTAWDRVRKALLSHLGQGMQNLDKCWFSKLEATEHQDKAKQLSLKAPSSFVRDFVNQNYGRLIEKVCNELGIAVDNYQTVSA